MKHDLRNAATRRGVLRAVGAAAGVAGLAGCVSNDGTPTEIEYPTDDIESVVPYSTGGGFDAYSRLAAPYWEEYLGTDVVVNNVVGGGGASGGTQVYNAEPDGHTIVLWQANDSLLVQVSRDVGYDVREMTKIGALTKEPAALIVREDLGLETWDEFTDSLGDLNFATQGAGTMAHLGVAFIGELTGSFTQEDANFVHYGGTGEALAGLERGEVNAFLITSPSSAIKTVQGVDGTEIFMAFSDPDPIEWYFEEHGIEPRLYSTEAGVEEVTRVNETVHMSRFYLGPPDVPEEILEEQRSAFQEIVDDEEFREEASEAFRPVLNPDDHEYVDEVVESTYEKWTSEPFNSIIEDVID